MGGSVRAVGPWRSIVATIPTDGYRRYSAMPGYNIYGNYGVYGYPGSGIEGGSSNSGYDPGYGGYPSYGGYGIINRARSPQSASLPPAQRVCWVLMKIRWSSPAVPRP